MQNKVLAVNGGKKELEEAFPEMFRWPIVTHEDEEAVLGVLRAGTMSGTDISKAFEKEYAKWAGATYGLATCNGTAALQEALWACGVTYNTEVICPSMTYWASCASVLSLGGEVCFADIEPDSLCLDPEDIEHRITDKTVAIMVVHYAGHPANMDKINAIAQKHSLKVIEDASHAQGGFYKNKMCGTLGDISGTSLMGGKAFAVGEGGIVLTSNRELIEKCMLFGHYERLGYSQYSLASEKLEACSNFTKYIGIPMGGVKHRMNQTCSAMGQVQLKYYPERCANINKAMNYFWDQLADLPGIHAHRTTEEGCSMGGWYNPRGLFNSEELDGLTCERFCEAIRAEGVRSIPGTNYPLHKHPYFLSCDALNRNRKVIENPEYLPVSENTAKTVYTIPWFKHFDTKIIDRYVAVFRKVIENYKELL